MSASLSVLPFLGAALLVTLRYEADIGRIVYGDKGLLVPLLLGCLAASILLGGLGFVLGFNSAGQRRNERSTQSWIAFFLGASICTMDLIMLLAFVMLRHQVASS